MGGVSVGGIDNSHEVSTAVGGVSGGADGVISSAVNTGDVHNLCLRDSNNEGEGKDEGSGFHIEIFICC